MSSCQDVSLRAMEEGDLRQVMPIEIDSFEDPWTPLAFVSDLRYNPLARYVVACSRAGGVLGYVGWWQPKKKATLLKLAVAEGARGRGIGSLLVREACRCSRKAGCPCIDLTVRESNKNARVFYAALDFADVDVLKGYYGDEDAVLMAKELGRPCCSDC